MNEKQQLLISYFNNLPEPMRPRATGHEESIEESFAPVVVTEKPSPDSVRRMLESRLSRSLAEAGREESVNAEDLEESVVGAVNKTTEAAAEPRLLRRPVAIEQPITERIIEVAIKATEKALNDDELNLEEEDILEAIVIPGKRPVLDIVDGDISTPPPDWEYLSDYRATIRGVLPSIGRVDVPDLLTVPYGGTGFFVGEGLLLTNRHVARLFVEGVGAGAKYLTFLSDRNALFDPQYEVGDPDTGAGSDRYEVVEPLLVHPHWDAALLRVRAVGNAQLPKPLTLAQQQPPGFDGGAMQQVMVVGYPMLDGRNTNLAEQMNIFRRIFGRKRLMPGYMSGYIDVTTKWNALLHATKHDATTLGGNSGSAVIDLTTGIVLALHFGGKYLQSNYGVPVWELAQDGRFRDEFKLNFIDYPGAAPGAGSAPGTATPIWLKAWDNLKPLVQEEAAPTTTVTSSASGPASSVVASSSTNVSIGPVAPTTDAPLRLPIAPDWFERVSNVDLMEAMRRDAPMTEQLIRATLLPDEADDLIRDLRRGLSAQNETTEEGIFDFLAGGPKTDQSLPEIIFLHGIMGSHLAAYGGFGGRVWLSPLAFAAGSVAERLALSDDGERDLSSRHVLYPDGNLRMVYEKAARKWRLGGFVVHEFAYDWRKSLANAADRLHLFVESLRLERPAKRFALVCHSMGALVAALYAARHPEWSTRVTQAVFMGAPLRGSYVPIEALFGSYPLLPKFALLDRLDELDDYMAMARTLPGLIDMLPDPDIFPDAAPLYQRASWPEPNAPAQLWLDQSRQVKRLLASSPILETARLIVSTFHPTVGEVSLTGGRLRPGARNRPGDGTVPTRSAAGRSGATVYRATYSHGELPREPTVIKGVEELLKNGRCDLPLLSRQEIEDNSPVAEAITESLEDATTADLNLRFRSGIFTQRDADFLLRADHSTLPGSASDNLSHGGD